MNRSRAKGFTMKTGLRIIPKPKRQWGPGGILRWQFFLQRDFGYLRLYRVQLIWPR
jgi:hypothetical protein